MSSYTVSAYEKEEVRCKICGLLLFKKIAELPFEISSTGALIMSLKSEIKCDRCKCIDTYSVFPSKKI